MYRILNRQRTMLKNVKGILPQIAKVEINNSYKN